MPFQVEKSARIYFTLCRLKFLSRSCPLFRAVTLFCLSSSSGTIIFAVSVGSLFCSTFEREAFEFCTEESLNAD